MKQNTIVAIGALGGSGTRVVAQILMDAGIFMGDDLNVANDNLVFTRLFKNPRWFENTSQNNVNKRLKLFEKYMTNGHLSFSEKLHIAFAAYTNPSIKSNSDYYSKLFSEPIIRTNKTNFIWGWKEPNTQIYIEEIANYSPNLKYIHVIRHGLDMAFSDNKQQLKNWGYRFNIHLKADDDEKEIARKQLDYWIKSNTNAIEKGRELLDDRFHLLYHEKLCKQPKIEIKNLMNFIGHEINDSILASLASIPTISGSGERYKKNDCSIFSEEQLREVENLGFSISKK
ncbi:MAG: sulfotransferase [Bacteroidia bacterium]